MGFKGKSISVASYDAGNRLTAWNRAGADENHSQTWDYDDAGNWNSTTKDGDTESRDHSISNQITQLDGKAVSHDLKGNLTEYEYDRTDYRVKYDLDNRIVEVKADSETIRYRYDALGRRIVSKGDDETILIWWGDSECAEYEHRASQDAIQNDIMGHPTRLNSVIARDTEDRENRVELQWYHKNYLDHVYAVSDDNGNLIEHYRYTAFGEPEIYSATGARRNTSAIANTVMWNTRRYDADNGLYYYKFRHYAANIGRWLGRDPIEEDGGINLYAFVGNEPIMRWDVLGFDFKIRIEGNAFEKNTNAQTRIMGAFTDKTPNWQPKGGRSKNLKQPTNTANTKKLYDKLTLFLVTANRRMSHKKPTGTGILSERRRGGKAYIVYLTQKIEITIDSGTGKISSSATKNNWSWSGVGPEKGEYISLGSILSSNTNDHVTSFDYTGSGGWSKKGPFKGVKGPLKNAAGSPYSGKSGQASGPGYFPNGFPKGTIPEMTYTPESPTDRHRTNGNNGTLPNLKLKVKCEKK